MVALPLAHRLKSNRDFRRVYRKGQRASTRHLAVRALLAPQFVGLEAASRADQQSQAEPLSSVGKVNRQSDKSAGECSPALFQQQTKDTDCPTALAGQWPSRFGISISRKVSKRAVVRNRIKRQLKAIIRRSLPNLSPGWWVVIIVRPSAVECSFDDFLRELEYLLKKLEIVT